MKPHNPNLNLTPGRARFHPRRSSFGAPPSGGPPLRALRVSVVSLFVLAVLSSGCKITHFEYTKDAVTVRATDARFLLRSAGKITVEPQTNNYPRLTVEAESSVESQAFHAFGRGLAEGIKK
jgi:hypothetical protein